MSVRTVLSTPENLVVDATHIRQRPLREVVGCLVPRAVRWPTDIRWALVVRCTGTHSRTKRRRPWRVTFCFQYPEPALHGCYRRAILPLKALT